jgi:membrane AbrB-like protein
MTPRLITSARMVVVYALAVLAGWIFQVLHVPLPWMIGPLLLTATVSISGVQISFPRVARHAGQVIVAGSVGLFFTTATLHVLIDQAVPMVAAALITILVGFLAAALFRRMAGGDPITASLACVPLGPLESANLAEHYRVDPGPVAFVQTLRIALIVTTIPPVLVWLEPNHLDISRALGAKDWTLAGIAITLGAATLVGKMFDLLRISNPFFLGAICGSAAAMHAGLPVSALPFAVIAAGQIFLGTSLGAAFNRPLLRKAKDFIPAGFVGTVLLLFLCMVVALGISALTGANWMAMVLATTPGSVTEMALTAKLLAADPALVTAFHIVRIFIMIPFAPLIFAVVERVTREPRAAPGE